MSRDSNGRLVKRSRVCGRAKGMPDKITAPIRAVHAENEGTRVAAIKELLDRGYGKSPQPQTGEGAEGPVRLVVSWLK